MCAYFFVNSQIDNLCNSHWKYIIFSCCSCALSCVFWIIGIALIVALAIGLGVYFGIFHGADDPETTDTTMRSLLMRIDETIKAS